MMRRSKIIKVKPQRFRMTFISERKDLWMNGENVMNYFRCLPDDGGEYDSPADWAIYPGIHGIGVEHSPGKNWRVDETYDMNGWLVDEFAKPIYHDAEYYAKKEVADFINKCVKEAYND